MRDSWCMAPAIRVRRRDRLLYTMKFGRDDAFYTSTSFDDLQFLRASVGLSMQEIEQVLKFDIRGRHVIRSPSEGVNVLRSLKVLIHRARPA